MLVSKMAPRTQLIAVMEGALLRIGVLLCIAVYSTYGGDCKFPSSWAGSWFQSGVPSLIAVNSTNIQMKGECSETESHDKFLLYDRSDDCYRCMVIHEKHESVLQYKESVCVGRDSLSSICDSISGDAALYSMFRKHPPPVPQPCPFRPAPFTFTYNRGSGDCANPPSRAESCTDESRLLLRYMACPDVPATESNVEELTCLATWKEGSTRYLVGQLSQVQRRNTIAGDEDTYRCFNYKSHEKGVYFVAQSGDATCNGLSSPTDGSRTMRLTTSDEERHRCHFPGWVVSHRTWLSLDKSRHYHFTTKNATLKIMSSSGGVAQEQRLVCHSILEQKENKHATLVAHVTQGCESGHTCLRIRYLGSGLLSLQQSPVSEAPHDACAHLSNHHHLLTTTSLPSARCAPRGRYRAVADLELRRRRELRDPEEEQASCDSAVFDGVSVGCSDPNSIELQTKCSTHSWSCHGSWEAAGGTALLASAPGGTRMCLLYTYPKGNDTSGAVTLRVSTSTCEGGAARGDRVYNLTLNGTCEQSSQYNSDSSTMTSRFTVLMTSLALLATLPR